MDLETYGLIGIIIIVLVIAFIEVVLTWIVATVIASFLGLNGISWWAFVIVTFFFINAVFNFLYKKR